MNTEMLDYTDSIKYLGFTFSSDKEMITICYDTKSTLSLRDSYVYFTVVQLMLNLLYFVVIVLAFIVFLWTHYKKSFQSKLRVAFNNVYRRMLKITPTE